MDDRTRDATTRVTRSGITEWTHICERCGTRMLEKSCKIVCGNCGYTRDCSDP